MNHEGCRVENGKRKIPILYEHLSYFFVYDPKGSMFIFIKVTLAKLFLSLRLRTCAIDNCIFQCFTSREAMMELAVKALAVMFLRSGGRSLKKGSNAGFWGDFCPDVGHIRLTKEVRRYCSFLTLNK